VMEEDEDEEELIESMKRPRMDVTVGSRSV
jgi:hypothetical protein